MLIESFIAACLSGSKAGTPINSSLKDVGISLHEYQPQSTLRHGYKKSSSLPNCVAVSESHIFAAQADKAVINVYSREKGNQEATVPFPERIHSLAYVDNAGLLVIGTAGGKIMLWEIASGRLTISSASHLQAVSSLCVTSDCAVILSGSADASVHVWSLPNLISFLQSSSSNTDSRSSRSPLRTFSSHRKGISALACGHSNTKTNFAVSASTDQTCYIWRLSDCQGLRTVLLPTTPTCFALDPADRAIYVGYDNGHVQSIDLYRTASGGHVDSILNGTNTIPVQSTMADTWTIPTATTGQANCLTLTYDGTVLLSGHDNGKILAWDVSKRRFQKDITDVGQPVTSITMLRPTGFLNNHTPVFEITNVVKPRLELNAITENGTCGVPAAYTLQVKLNMTARNTIQSIEEDEFSKDLVSPCFSKHLLDDAIQALLAGSADLSAATIDPAKDINLAKVERLEDQVEDLNGKIQELNEYINDQQSKAASSNGREDLRNGKPTKRTSMKQHSGIVAEPSEKRKSEEVMSISETAIHMQMAAELQGAIDAESEDDGHQLPDPPETDDIEMQDAEVEKVLTTVSSPNRQAPQSAIARLRARSARKG